MGVPDHLTCLLRNLYAGQEATVRTGHGTTDWFQIGKGAHQSCILSPCLFNLYAEYIMRNSGLEEAQAGIKIARRNINNLRYADDTTLMEPYGTFNSFSRLSKIPLLKCCTQYASKFGKLSSGHRTGKCHFSFQCQRMFKLPHNCTHLTH